ncbi:type II secretion system minor pseudopilin GspI [Pseudomonas abieticivorans]|uniref:type II secretion system minor pseudopilin GspI n=1 Tax=Pseudomonas abieticivorans TaxID=2931382 RepID=UPI0020BEA876|nr:type II secretion system minor pseudopilin GspI [Pseudomonas sp. PIA16]
MKAERGFTLLEMLVALAVFAILAAAVLGASQYAVNQSAGLERRVLAAWLLDNRLTELRLGPRPPFGEQWYTPVFAGRHWQLRQRVDGDAVVLTLDDTYRLHGWLPAR